jgi:hypothetical protein
MDFRVSQKNLSENNQEDYLLLHKKYRNPELMSLPIEPSSPLGYLDELEKEYDDPIAHFQEVPPNDKEENAKKKVTLAINMDETLPKDAEGTQKLWICHTLKIYHQLELDTFFKNKARSEPFKFNTTQL